MIRYVFDLDDTLIIHQKNIPMNIYIQKDEDLNNLLSKCKGECYIYTNGTLSHALNVINKMKIKDNFHKIYSRDNIPYMKPDIKSFASIQNDLNKIYKSNDIIYFFDDLVENLNSAKRLGWVTFWIHPNYRSGSSYPFIDKSYPDIKTCLRNIQNNYF